MMQALYLEIKNLIITTLNLEELSADDIDTDAALFGDGLGLDSIDALELGLAVKTAMAWCSPPKATRCASISSPLPPWPRLSTLNVPEARPMTESHDIYADVSALLVKLFEIDPEDIKPEARLYEDLELDSIDAVDMIVHLQKKTSKKIKAEEFKAVRTVQDVVDALERLSREA
jgi:acyl carrier protein